MTDNIDMARKVVEVAQARLLNLMAAECPGPHAFVQRRDRRPPWCKACNRTTAGAKVERE